MMPFSVFLRGNRPYYYVSFKNEETGGYLPAVSTKKNNEPDALRQAWAWYKDGVPRKGGKIKIETLSLRDAIRRADLTRADAEYIVGELKRRGHIASFVMAGSGGSVRFADFLGEFWDWERSQYVREKLRAEHSIHKNYVYTMASRAKNYWLPFFGDKLLGDLSPADIDRFVDGLSGSKNGGENKPLTNASKNMVIMSGTIPLRWAYRKRKIETDLTRDIVMFGGKSTERKILTPQEAAALFSARWEDERAKAANLTAMVTGMRAGELLGLLAGDLGEDSLLVRHSWNRLDKLKTTKTNTERVVELPFPSVMSLLRQVASLNPHGTGPDSYVFWSPCSASKPMEANLFVRGLRSALAAAGFSEEDARGYCFHAWRHFFTSYMRPRLADKLLQTQTGHKTAAMVDHYADHLLPGDRDKIRAAQVSAFAGLLPSG
jgi:integrase